MNHCVTDPLCFPHNRLALSPPLPSCLCCRSLYEKGNERARERGGKIQRIERSEGEREREREREGSVDIHQRSVCVA